MPQKGRRQADEAILLALACGATLASAARSAGVSQATAYRRTQEPEFKRRLQEMRADTVRRTAGPM